MKKDMKNREIMREHGNKQQVFHNKKVNYELDMEVNNEGKSNVEYQQEDIKHLKEQWDIDDEDEVQKITAAKKPMKIISLCV